MTNHGARPRTLDVTSYAEMCLNHRRADQAHPAFAKLFLDRIPAPAPDPAGPSPAARADEKPIWAAACVGGTGCPRHRGRRRGVRDRPGQVPGPGPLRGSPRRSGLRAVLRGPSGRSWTPFSACAVGSGSEPRAHPPSLRSAPQRQPTATRRWPWPAGSATWPKLRGCSIRHGSTTRPPWLRSLSQPKTPPCFSRLAAHVVFTGPALRSRDSVDAKPAGAVGPVAARHLRRPPDRAGPTRQPLASESLVRRTRPVRTPTPPPRAGAGPGPSGRGAGDELHDQLRGTGLRLGPPAELADKPGGVFLLAAARMPAPDDGSCLRPRPASSSAGTWLTGRAARARARNPVTLPIDASAFPAPRPSPCPANGRCRPRSRCCSRTGSAGSRRTAASTS